MTSVEVERTPPVWDDGAPAVRPPLDGEATADVCVVGLGAAGLTAVETVLAGGASVVGIDAGTIGGGASGRNGGFLLAGLAAFHHDAVTALGRDRATRLYRCTLEELDGTARRFPTLVRRAGSLRLAESEDEQDDCRAQLAAMRRDGLPVEPYAGPEGVGLRFPLDAAFQPLGRCHALADAVAARGARLFEATPATEIRGDGVSTPRGRVSCRAVVVCVDGGLELVLPELAGSVRTARAQMLATRPEPGLSLPAPVYARWGYDYWQQLPDGRVALGGGRDVGGEAEWTGETSVSEPVQSHLDAVLSRLGVRAPVTHRWAGSIGFSAGVLPVLAEPRPGVLAVGGYSGTGNLVGPIYARAAARQALGIEEPLRPLLTAPQAC